ncbi:MAG: HAMP domain-containing histidine kinase [Magnetococcales bacterium]|nr:HAMP domain-containing histidine kinase [Magnetococcales bacterium]
MIEQDTYKNNLRCFVALPSQYLETNNRVVDAIQSSLEKSGYIPFFFHDVIVPGDSFRDEFIGELAQSDCILADISNLNLDVVYMIGLAQAMGKGILLMSRGISISSVMLPHSLREYRMVRYSEHEIHDLEQKIIEYLNVFRLFPSQYGFKGPVTFSVDWDRLSERDIENLCKELLLQMGFRRLDWGKELREIDLVAEYPRKDPDGFEFNEIWFVSVGSDTKVFPEFDYLIHRVFRYTDHLDSILRKGANTNVTILFMIPGDSDASKYLARDANASRRFMKGGINIRTRIWDQNYLSSLVRKYPNIGYKYFSKEGQVGSKTRKTYEILYLENIALSERQLALINELESEKNRRVRAERDSVWKDIAFAAAHKIGNPIFAIETDLDPLAKRIREDRKEEVNEIIANYRKSIDKAKAIIEQFKSLTKAQEIRIDRLNLQSILNDETRKIISRMGIEAKIEYLDSGPVEIMGDAEKLTDCFDELVRNSTCWFDKEEKKITITILSYAPSPLPNFLDSSADYVLIHFCDTGVGIPIANKTKIFDAFFTTNNHGTGLGLALVRRIIDGHGGGIIESGEPGKGVDFEIFLPKSLAVG